MKQLIGFRMMCTKHNSPVIIDKGMSIAAMEEGEQNKGDYFFDTSECSCEVANALIDKATAEGMFERTREEVDKFMAKIYCSDDWSITPIFEA